MPVDCDFRIFVGLRATVSLRPGQFLFREGDLADALYIVSHGTLQITIAAASTWRSSGSGSARPAIRG